MKRVMIIGLVFLMLVLPMASAITEDEIKEKLNQIDINDFTYQIGEQTAIVKLPSSYKMTDYQNESLTGFEICNNNKWAAYWHQGNKFVVMTDFKDIWSWFVTLFGGGYCTDMNHQIISDLTPQRLLTSEVKTSYDIIWEEVTFDGKPAIKASLFGKDRTTTPPPQYEAYYYDRNSLLKLANAKVCNSDDPNYCMASQKGEIITRVSVVINKGVSSSEFDLFMPEGTEICRQSPKNITAAEDGVKALEETAQREERALTEQEWQMRKYLFKQASLARCNSLYEDNSTYDDYLRSIFLCVIDRNGAYIVNTVPQQLKISFIGQEVHGKIVYSKENLCVNSSLYREYECVCDRSPDQPSNFRWGCKDTEYTFESQDYYCAGECNIHSQPFLDAGSACSGFAQTPIPAICVDTDGGANYFEVGQISLKIFGGIKDYLTSTDRCETPKRLREAICENNQIQSVMFNCPVSCIDGKCVNEDYKKYLNDSVKTYTAGEYLCASSGDFGVVIHETNYGRLFNAKENLCVNQNLFRKYSCVCKNSPECTEYEIGAQDYSCSSCDLSRWQTGVICEGEKPLNSVCTDSDGGKNYYISGQASVILPSGEIYQSGSDFCGQHSTREVDGKEIPIYGLMEAYCDETGRVSSDFYECPKGCQDGACIQ